MMLFETTMNRHRERPRFVWFRYALLAVMLGAGLRPAGAAALAPGDYRFELPFDGTTRSYLVHVPPQARSGPLPVVISLHGGGGNAEQHRRSTHMDAAADRDAYIAVYPNGSGRAGSRLLTWNAGGCCGYAERAGIDDVGFIRRLIDTLVARGGVDAARVYVVGHSNGGMMAHRLGAELSDRIAAIGAVSGAHVPEISPAARAVPVVHLHSVDDPRAPYAGGLGPPYPLTGTRVMHVSVDATLAAWARHDGCAPAPTEREARQGNGQTARLLVFENCRDGASVALWKITGGGHGWPGATPARTRLIGPPTTVVDANAELWAFLRRYSLDE